MALRANTPIQFSRYALLACCLLAATTASAISVAPSPSSDGNYTVSWSTGTGCIYDEPWPNWITFQCWTLQERVGTGAWISVSTPDGATSWNAIARSENTYHYRILYSYGDINGGSSQVADGPVSVVVQNPVSAPVSTGFDDRYSVHVGDTNADGYSDVYLKYRPPFVFVDVGGVLAPIQTDRAKVDEFVLENNGSGFSINSNPTQQQLAVARQLPAASALTFVVDDINYDGADDVYLGNLSAQIPGASDLFVFSSTTHGDPPQMVTALDQGKLDFFEATIRWHDNPTYFDRTLTVGTRVPFAGASFGSPLLPQMLVDCQAMWGTCVTYNGLLTTYFGGWAACFAAVWAQGIDADIACNLNGVHIMGVLAESVTVKDFSGFSSEVAQFVASGEGIGGWSIEDAADVLESILGVVIGGMAATQRDPDDIDVDEPEEERAYEVMRVIRNVMASIEAGIYPGDTVYVTLRRPVLSDSLPVGEWAMHLALEYRPPGSGTVVPEAQTISAIAVKLSGDSYLNSEPDYELENNNRKVGVLTSTVYPTAAALWAALKDADSNYRNYTNYHLKYALFPWQINEGHRNSNGFVHGISNVVSGTETLDFGYDRYGFPAVTSFEDVYLGAYPVPPEKFDDSEE